MRKVLLSILILFSTISGASAYDAYGVYNITDGANSPSRLYTPGFSPIAPINYGLGGSCGPSSTCPGGYSVVFDGSRNKLYPYNNGTYITVPTNGNYYCAQIDTDPPSISITGWPNGVTPNTSTRLNTVKFNPLKDLRITVQENTLKIRKIKVIIGNKSGEINYINGTITGPTGTRSFGQTLTGYVSLNFSGIATQIFGLDLNDQTAYNMLDDGRDWIKVIACDTSTDPQNFKTEGDVNCRSVVGDGSFCAGESQCNVDGNISNPINVDNNGPKLIVQTDTPYGLSENASYLLVDGTQPDNTWKRRSLNIKLGTEDTFEGPTVNTTIVGPIQGACTVDLACIFGAPPSVQGGRFDQCCMQ